MSSVAHFRSPDALEPAHPSSAHRAIEELRDRLASSARHGRAEVAVPAEALRVVLELVDEGDWDHFDGHRRWAAPWRPCRR
jgi:hypothetical protein